MVKTIGGQIKIAANNTNFPIPVVAAPELPSLALVCQLPEATHVHQVADATVGSSYSASVASLIRDPFTAAPDFTFQKEAGPAWLSVSSGGTLDGTPAAGDAGQNLLTLRVTDPAAGLTGIFTAGVLVRSGTGNQAPVFLDHPAMVRVSAADDEGVVLPLRFHDADAGDTHVLAISGGNTGNAFGIDDAGRLVKAGALPADMTWTLTVTVTDGSGASATLPLEVASGSAAPTGGASVEHWFNLPGSAITDLTGSPRYPGEPTIDAMTGDLEDPGPGKNSGTRVRGWIHPPATGDYRFWISAQDRAEFHLSTDDTPGNLAKVCQSTTATGFRNYDASSSQKSGLLALVSGQRYYFEIIQKNAGTTGDFAGSYSVAWQGKGIPSREPVAAAHLSPWRSLTPAFQDGTIHLLPALSGAAYREILRSKLKTLHLYPGLTFSKVSGPAWLSVSPAGEIGGTPGAGDAGENVFVLRATAPGGLFDEATVAIAVSENAAPQFSSGTLALPALPEGQGPAATLATFATDANLTARFGVGDRLSFSLVSGPGWLHCEPTGLLFGAPGAADIGTNTFTVAVTDLGGLSTEATLTIQVTDVPTVPVLTVDPIELTATQGAPVGGSLASFAYDPDAGDTLTFAKVSGPAWLAVAADGTLSGTPGGSDGDVNAFTVSVQDALGQGATATLLVTVGDGNPHFHEGFEASAGTPVSGSGSGSGWGGLWSGGTESILGENVAFPGIDGIAQALAFTGGEDFSRTLARSHGTGHGEGEHPELWLSYVLDTGSPVNSGYEFRLVLRDGTTDVLSFGKEVNASWLLRSGSATANLGTGINSGNAGLWFAVVRLTYDGSSTIATGWLAKSTDTALDIADPASFTRTGTITVPGKISFDRVALLSNNTTTARIDEVSMAASYPRLLTLATAPEFLEDLVSCRTVPDQYFMGTLAGRVESKLADPGLVFTKLDGPAWLMVTPEGDLLGTPPEGLHGFTVAVTDRNGNADTTQLEITATATASLVSESFAGATGAQLHGSGSGTGWAVGAVWSRYAGTSGSTKYEAGNSFPGTLSAGGSAALAGGEDLRRTLARSYTLGNGMGEDPALWLSFMVENTGGISPGHEYRLVLQSGGAHVVSFGKEQNQPWRLSGGGTSVNLTANNSTGNSGNWLAMVRLIYDDSSTIVTGWLAEASDPGLDPADASTYARSASVTIPGKASFDQVAILSHNTTSARLDEIFLAREMGALSTGADHDGDSYPDTIDPDDDNDGLPDHWEIPHGLGPLVAGPDLDSDGDGVSDHDEFVADTDPHSAGSRQTLSIAPPDGGTVTLAFPTSTARYYDIEWSDTLDGQSWQSLGTIHAGTGGILHIEEALSGGSRFYRLRVLLP